MERVGTLSIVMLVGVAAVSPAPAQEPGDHLFEDRDAEFVFDGIHFPAVVDTFAAVQASRWPRASLGVGLDYRSPLDPSAQIDLYVYPQTEGAEATPDERVAAEFEAALEGIRQYAQRQGNGMEITIGDQQDVTMQGDGGRPFVGRVAETTMSNARGGERRSLLYVFEKDGRFFKYRITYNPALRTLLEPRLQRFITETLERVAVP